MSASAWINTITAEYGEISTAVRKQQEQCFSGRADRAVPAMSISTIMFSENGAELLAA
jgi:hypothetical protein